MRRRSYVWVFGLLALWLWPPAPVGAQDVFEARLPAAADSGAVEGIVVEAVTGRPLPGTQVRIVGLARQDVTHDAGDFHLVNLPAGRHTVLFERIGYRREIRQVELAAGETHELRVELHASAIELPGLVVTGAARASLGEQAVRPANVMRGQELARNMDVTLAGTLEHEPGLAATSVGPATSRPVIRGLGGDRVLVLEDGARVGDLSSTSSDHALSVDPLNAQRIEVVRGPAALLYGGNAIGGVINLIRDEVPSTLPEQPRGAVSAQAQSVNRAGGIGGFGELANGRTALRGEVSFREAGDVTTPRGTLSNTSLRTLGASVGASRIRNWGHYGAAYRFYDNQYGIPGGFVGSHPEGVEVEMRRHALHGVAAVSRAFGPFTGWEIDGKYTHYYHRELEEEGIIGTEFGLLTGAVDASARHAEWGPFASGVIGTRVSWQDYAAGGSSGTPPTVEVSAAGYMLEELDVASLRVQGGVRYDWHRIRPTQTAVLVDIGDVRTRTFGSLSASFGVLYGVSDAVSVGASVARAYRTPDTGELFSQGPHLAAYSFEIGNPDLDAEVGVGMDVFVRAQRDRFSGEVAAFVNTIDNYIHYRRTAGVRDALPVYQATGADARLTGMEADATVEVIRHVILNGSVSWVRGELTEDEQPLPMMPPLRGQVTARYERPAYFVGVTVRAAAEQDRIAEFETTTPGYTVLDADAGYRWEWGGRLHSITVSAGNVTDAVVYDHLSRVKDILPAPGAGVSAVYRMVF